MTLDIVEVGTMHALHSDNSHMESNLSLSRSKYGTNFQSHSLAHCIKVATTVEQLDSQSNCLFKQLYRICYQCLPVWRDRVRR